MAELCGHFAHNEQSLRVVDYLEREGAGLNLTDAVRDGIVHHTGKEKAKTLEGRIVHHADRIAYLCHDYDDSLRAGLLRPEDLPPIVADALGDAHSAMITGFVSDIITFSEGTHDISFSPALQEVMKVFRSFMFERIYHSPKLAREREQAVFVLRQLYEYFIRHFDRLPQEFLDREERWGRQQTVVDYVAGLTDSYAVQLFHEIFVPPVGMTIKGHIG